MACPPHPASLDATWHAPLTLPPLAPRVSYHKKVGVVSQETQLFNSTIGENIAYGLEGPIDNADIVAAAKAAQACPPPFLPPLATCSPSPPYLP